MRGEDGQNLLVLVLTDDQEVDLRDGQNALLIEHSFILDGRVFGGRVVPEGSVSVFKQDNSKDAYFTRGAIRA